MWLLFCFLFGAVHLLLIETRPKCPKRPEFLLSGLLFRKVIISCWVFEHGHWILDENFIGVKGCMCQFIRRYIRRQQLLDEKLTGIWMWMDMLYIYYFGQSTPKTTCMDPNNSHSWKNVFLFRSINLRLQSLVFFFPGVFICIISEYMIIKYICIYICDHMCVSKSVLPQMTIEDTP